MPAFRRTSKKEKAHTDGQTELHGKSDLHHHARRNRFFFSSVICIILIGLIAALPLLLSERISNQWPWIRADLILLIGLSLTVLVSISYMIRQQRNVSSMYKQLQRLQEMLTERTDERCAYLPMLTNAGCLVDSEPGLQGIFDSITKMCVKTFKCHRASLMSSDKQTGELVVRSVSGHSMKEILDIRQRIGEGIAGWAAEHREALLLGHRDDSKKYPGLELNDPSIASAMVVPIIIMDDLVGVINVSTQSPDIEYNEEDLRALRMFAENAGISIRNSEQANREKQTVTNLLDA